ncbi:pyridoxamine 5'-phosphate oxidase family protein [Arsenicicoccus dermatophilus]|uniref:pyridoxamine 5'-phosphate oxidase family protein n=1 Tax=Arsenicicoccus dermatophilus TaxID=1076331 RepID=UPI001F4CA96D|nr:pyridoxamine 5'-phosphate oxidase family protein [Arsenicicoccus dermatophilus]MCH8611929.1 pyridoxamine 5'-phosphate oxidase family protein [Arsenicicoccus dermatophilus]
MTDEQQQKVAEIIRSTRIAMMTHVDGTGRLVSHPMATQDVDFAGTVLFVAERHSQKCLDLQANPQVNLAYAGNGAWVSLSGTARIVDDTERLKELWGTFTDAWMEGGPDNPENVLVEVTGDTAEYWDAPGGSKVVQLANLVKAAVTGKRVEGDNEVVDL